MRHRESFGDFFRPVNKLGDVPGRQGQRRLKRYSRHGQSLETYGCMWGHLGFVGSSRDDQRRVRISGDAWSCLDSSGDAW